MPASRVGHDIVPLLFMYCCKRINSIVIDRRPMSWLTLSYCLLCSSPFVFASFLPSSSSRYFFLLPSFLPLHSLRSRPSSHCYLSRSLSLTLFSSLLHYPFSFSSSSVNQERHTSSILYFPRLSYSFSHLHSPFCAGRIKPSSFQLCVQFCYLFSSCPALSFLFLVCFCTTAFYLLSFFLSHFIRIPSPTYIRIYPWIRSIPSESNIYHTTTPHHFQLTYTLTYTHIPLHKANHARRQRSDCNNTYSNHNLKQRRIPFARFIHTFSLNTSTPIPPPSPALSTYPPPRMLTSTNIPIIINNSNFPLTITL